jgi:hypothetical protein
MTFVQDGNPDYLDEQKTIINFFKRRLFADVIKEVQTYQLQGYPFIPVDIVLTWLRLTDIPTTVLEENNMYDKSLLIEPRDGSLNKGLKRAETSASPSTFVVLSLNLHLVNAVAREAKIKHNQSMDDIVVPKASRKNRSSSSTGESLDDSPVDLPRKLSSEGPKSSSDIDPRVSITIEDLQKGLADLEQLTF